VIILQRRVNIKPRFWLCLIVFMLLCFGASSVVAQVHYNRISQRVSSLNAQKMALTNHINQLSSRLGYVKTDAYIERVARDELNMIMPGEIRYVSN